MIFFRYENKFVKFSVCGEILIYHKSRVDTRAHYCFSTENICNHLCQRMSNIILRFMVKKGNGLLLLVFVEDFECECQT